uniref:Uncharacterized protein n=2 Tax=Rhodosorus marinus TaxID=101924 RepID=A0A7S2ZDP8_9RHOD|mmetsp:Transcript_15764/g.64397  ORF Transcript_15764/g.64397 Transcript_15764/m.64397 type:complete len:586 (+) Transcript_15764:557-2314(+)
MKRLSQLILRKKGEPPAEKSSETRPDVRRSAEKVSAVESLRRLSRNYSEQLSDRGTSNEFKSTGSLFGGNDVDETTKLILDSKKGIVTVPELLEELMSLTSIVSDEALFNLNDFLSDESVLKECLALLTGESTCDVVKECEQRTTARERYSYQWILSTLIACGPKELKRTIAANDELCDYFGRFFESQNAADEVMTSNVVRVMLSVLHTQPAKFAANLFSSDSFGSSLVRSIRCHSVSELLPRFISSKEFYTKNDLHYGPPIVPGILGLGKGKILDALADKFIEALDCAPDGPSSSREQIMDSAASASSQISIRVMMVSGHSSKYIGDPGSVEYYLDEIDVLSNPGSLARTLGASLLKYQENVDDYFGLSMAMRGIATILEVVHQGKNSDSVSILQQIKKLNTSKVEEVLYSNLESLQGILRNHAQIPRTLKVHLVELFMNMVRICSRAHAHKLVESEVFKDLVDVFFEYDSQPIVHKYASTALIAALQKNLAEVRHSLLCDTPLVVKLVDEWNRMDIGNSKKARQSNAGEIVDIVICIRDAMKYSKITKEEVTAAIGDEAYKEFRHLCNKQLPMMEEMRLSRVF